MHTSTYKATVDSYGEVRATDQRQIFFEMIHKVNVTAECMDGPVSLSHDLSEPKRNDSTVKD